MARRDRVTEAIRKEVSLIIHEKLKDPRLGFVTVIKVELTPDLRLAKIFYSVLGKEEEHKKTKEALDSALGFIRRLIAQRIRLRLVPEISFKEDRSAEYSIRIQEALDEIKELTEAPPPPKEAGRKKRKVARREPKKSSRKPKKK